MCKSSITDGLQYLCCTLQSWEALYASLDALKMPFPFLILKHSIVILKTLKTQTSPLSARLTYWPFPLANTKLNA